MDRSGNFLTAPHKICYHWRSRVKELHGTVISTGRAHFSTIEYDRCTFQQKKLVIFPVNGQKYYLCILLDVHMFESELMSRFNTNTASTYYDDMKDATQTPVVFVNKAGLTEVSINQDRFKLRVWSPNKLMRNSKYGTMHGVMNEMLVTMFEKLAHLKPDVESLQKFLETIRIAYEFDSISLYECIGGTIKDIFSIYDCSDPRRKQRADDFAKKAFANSKKSDSSVVIDKTRYQAHIFRTENIEYAIVATISIFGHVAWSAESYLILIFYLADLFYLIHISPFAPSRMKRRFSELINMHSHYACYQFVSDKEDGHYSVSVKYDTIFNNYSERNKIVEDNVNARKFEKGTVVAKVRDNIYAKIQGNEAVKINDDMYIKDVFVEDITETSSVSSKLDVISKELDLIYSTLGMHKLINQCTVADDKLSQELGYKESITDLNDLVNPTDKLFLQQACEIKSIFRLRTAEKRNIWYSIICSDSDLCEFNGYVFKADISTVATTLHENTNSPLFDAIGNMFALWTIDITTGEILYSISLAKDIKNISDLRNHVYPKDQPVFSDIIRNMSEHVQQHRDIKMNISDSYQWYDVTFVMTTGNTIMVYALNVNKENNIKQKIESIQDQVNLALYQTEIAEWIIPSCNPNEGHYILNPNNLDWNTISKQAMPEGVLELHDALRTTIKTGKPFSIEMELSNGKWLTARGCVIDQKEHSIIGITYDSTNLMTIKQNLKEEKKKALDASMAKSTFVANMSHEIRAPLQGMFAVLELLNMTNMDMDTFINVKSVKKSFIRLLDLLNNILDLAKLESNKMMPSKIPFDLLKIIEPIITHARQQIDTAPIKFIVDIAPEIPLMFYGDPHILARVLENLLSNAVKFTEKGTITVSVTYEEEILQVICKDTGIGIIKEKMDVLFDPFEGLNHEGTRKFYGTSIGLSVAGSMIRLVGGHIKSVSKLGNGSTFTAIFPYNSLMERYFVKKLKLIPVQWFVHPNIMTPVVDRYAAYYGIKIITSTEDANETLTHVFFPDTPDAWSVGRKLVSKFPQSDGIVFTTKIEGQKEKLPDKFCYSPSVFLPSAIFSYVYEDKARSNNKKNIKKKAPTLAVTAKVLLADDNPTNQIVMSKIFDKIGCKHICVGTGKQAIDQLEANIDNQFDIIIMDMKMPDMDGPTATKTIRSSDKSYKNIPIVAITASILKEDEIMCLDAGMNAFLTKPISMNRLANVIQENMQKK